MNLNEAMSQRHSVRSYTMKKIDEEIVEQLNQDILRYNQEANLSIQLFTEDANVFRGMMAHFGGFHGVTNYIALVGPSGDETVEKLGYYGEKLVLKAQQLGLNTCWVAVTYKKGNCKAVIKENQEMFCVIAIGYGRTEGVAHKSKPMERLCKVEGEMPAWFKEGMKAVMYAPTAMNKQKFCICFKDGKIEIQTYDEKYGKIEKGILKCHFELGAKIEL